MSLAVKNTLLATVFLGLILTSFQNCSPYHGPGSSDFSSVDASGLQGFISAKQVLSNHCLSCHSAGGTASSYRLDFSSEKEFIQSGYVVPGDIDSSKLLTRTIHYTGPASEPRNMPTNSTSFTVQDYNILKNWVAGINSQNSSSTSFQCEDPNLASDTYSYVLTKKQLSNTIEDLFGSQVLQNISTQLSVLPEESFDHLSYERMSALTSSKVEAYFYIAEAVADYIKNNDSLMTKFFGSCSFDSAYNQSCVDYYLNNHAKRILRRPLKSSEKIFARGLVSNATNFRSGLSNLISYHLQSPYFLWRLELGNAAQDDPSALALSPYEIATRISYLTTDSTPDLTLMNAAARGDLADINKVKEQVTRLLNTTRGKDKLIQNILHWSKMDQVNGFTALPDALLQGINIDSLDEAMANEAKKFVNYIVYSQNGSFKDLLTSKVSFASHSGLANLYGHSPVVSQPATVAGLRQGLLLRSPAFTWPTARTSLIRRGVAFQENILCNEIAAPNVDISDARDTDAFTEDELLFHTNREAVAHQTRDPICMTCHSFINPTGFVLEGLGPLGELRTEEKIFDMSGNHVRTLPIDTKASVPVSKTRSVEFADAQDMINFIADSPEGTACFSRKTYRMIYEKREHSNDNCLLKEAHEKIGNSELSILDGMAELIANKYIFNKYITD